MLLLNFIALGCISKDVMLYTFPGLWRANYGAVPVCIYSTLGASEYVLNRVLFVCSSPTLHFIVDVWSYRRTQHITATFRSTGQNKLGMILTQAHLRLRPLPPHQTNRSYVSKHSPRQIFMSKLITDGRKLPGSVFLALYPSSFFTLAARLKCMFLHQIANTVFPEV